MSSDKGIHLDISQASMKLNLSKDEFLLLPSKTTPHFSNPNEYHLSVLSVRAEILEFILYMSSFFVFASNLEVIVSEFNFTNIDSGPIESQVL